MVYGSCDEATRIGGDFSRNTNFPGLGKLYPGYLLYFQQRMIVDQA